MRSLHETRGIRGRANRAFQAAALTALTTFGCGRVQSQTTSDASGTATAARTPKAGSPSGPQSGALATPHALPPAAVPAVPTAGLQGRGLPSECHNLEDKIAFAAEPGTACDAARCAAARGECGTAGLGCSDVCIYKATDVGKACRDGRDCQGDCMAKEDAPRDQPTSGRCSALQIVAGCKNRVRDGLATGLLCVD